MRPATAPSAASRSRGWRRHALSPGASCSSRSTRKGLRLPVSPHPYGDLRTATLEEIWNGETAQDMRRSLARGDIPKFCLDHSAACPLVMAARSRPPPEDRRPCHHGRERLRSPDRGLVPSGAHPGSHPLDVARPRSSSSARRAAGGCSWRRSSGERTRDAVRPRPDRDRRPGPGKLPCEKRRWNCFSFRLPRALAGPIVKGRILTKQTWVPAEEGLSGDTRQLGVAVRRIWVA